MPQLNLSAIADVSIDLAPAAAARRGFDLGMIMGTSEIIPVDDRIVEYESLAEMISGGWDSSHPEYQAAALYFASDAKPTKVAIGSQYTGETPLEAFTACREKNSEWYVGSSLDAANSDHLDIAEYVEALDTTTVYFMQNEEADVLNKVNNNLFQQIKDLEYRRTLGMWSESPYALASIVGYAMGQTSDLAKSAYTLNLKRMPGATPDDLTTQQISNIRDNNGNVYITRARDYPMFVDGRMFDGTFFDEVIYLDKLANEIQLAVTDLLYQSPKVPQTEPGMARLRTVIGKACDRLVSIGFLAPGKWTGDDLLSVKSGDYLPDGYLVLSEKIDDQSDADRDNRIAPPIYVLVKLAGAIHSVVIRVNVNR